MKHISHKKEHHSCRKANATTSIAKMNGTNKESNPTSNSVSFNNSTLNFNGGTTVIAPSFVANNGANNVGNNTNADGSQPSQSAATTQPSGESQSAATTATDGTEVIAAPPPRKGFNGLALLPPGLLPISKEKISAEHCLRYWKCYWILDPDRKKNWEDNIAYDSDSSAVFQRRLILLHEEVSQASQRLLRKKIVGNFNSAGIVLDGQNFTGAKGAITRFIKSKKMKDSFIFNPLIPFSILFENVHNSNSDTADWFPDELRDWCRTRANTPFDFVDFEIPEKKNEKKKRQNNILLIGVESFKNIFAQIHSAEEIEYGVSLRKRASARKGTAKKNATHHQMMVNLGPHSNPKDILTYLLINKSRHPQVPDNPTQRDHLSLLARSPYSFHAAMMVLSAQRNGMSKETAEREVIAAVNQVYGSGIQNMVASAGQGNSLQHPVMQGGVSSNMNGGGTYSGNCPTVNLTNLASAAAVHTQDLYIGPDFSPLKNVMEHEMMNDFEFNLGDVGSLASPSSTVWKPFFMFCFIYSTIFISLLLSAFVLLDHRHHIIVRLSCRIRIQVTLTLIIVNHEVRLSCAL